ncbi:MAG: ATP-dependent DNA helicase DinG [Rhodoferax sp.]
MGSDTLAEQALAAFDALVAANPGFRPRTGQRDMARHIAQRMADLEFGQGASPGRALALIQAGTGVGKSAAYLAPLVYLAQALRTRLVVSTATVALQEQLMQKDLPALARTLETPLTFALAKGRGRYVCQLKLERLSTGRDVEWTEGWTFDDEVPGADPALKSVAADAGPSSSGRARLSLYEKWNRRLVTGDWNGDLDTLIEPPSTVDWALVAADRHSCSGRHCPAFRSCSYYRARMALTQAQVIVANHDLVLASLGRNALPELDKAFWVFDEAHHLPAVALAQFASAIDLSHLRWLERLPRVVLDVAQKMDQALGCDVVALAGALRVALDDLARLAQDALGPLGLREQVERRWAHGVLPEAWIEPSAQAQRLALALMSEIVRLGTEMKNRSQDDPSQAARYAVLFARLGQLVPRLSGLIDWAEHWLRDAQPPLAKWLRAQVRGGLVSVSAHASPVVAAQLLRENVWKPIRAAVLTSATLTSCGRFDFFLQESGLQSDPDVSLLAVSSPFDYTRQGQLWVVPTQAQVREIEAFTREMLAALLADLRTVRHGALVLFTSRMQLQAALDALDPELRERVLVQGQMGRNRLLATHMARVESGQPSVVFGLQSFGEGVDLPGALCETVFITKLPFAAPSDPVEQARAEWLERQGMDAFEAWVVPATSVRLQQWTGRAIRTENDQARVICYDKRLLRTGYGLRLLQGLPPYALFERDGDHVHPRTMPRPLLAADSDQPCDGCVNERKRRPSTPM